MNSPGATIRMQLATAPYEGDGEYDQLGGEDPSCRLRPGSGPSMADSPDGADVLGTVRVVGQFAAQMADVNIHDMFIAEPVRSPDTVDQLAPAERPARTAGQRLQEGRTPCA